MRIARKTYHKNDQKQEENIGDVVELKPQVLRDERQRCIFGRPDFVSRKLLKRMALLVPELRGQRNVEEQCSAFLIVARGVAVCVTLALTFALVGRVRVIGVVGVVVVVPFLPHRITTSRMPLLFGRTCPLVYPVYDGYPLYSAALDRHFPRRPSRPLWSLVCAMTMRAFTFRHCCRVTGRARSTRWLRQSGPLAFARCSFSLNFLNFIACRPSGVGGSCRWGFF